jgi:hypothetical protein
LDRFGWEWVALQSGCDQARLCKQILALGVHIQPLDRQPGEHPGERHAKQEHEEVIE